MTHPPGVFWRPNPAFVRELADSIGRRRVLEIFAGNGYLASQLAALGVSIRATSVLSGMDAHSLGLHYPVAPLDAVAAVQRHGDYADLLLVCWPTVTAKVLRAVHAWGAEREIIYIGEVTDYAKGHLGGCATDEFFEQTEVIKTFSSYRGNMLERAELRRLIVAS